MNKLAAVMRLTRIEHSIMLVIAVVAAELIVGQLPSPYIILLSLVAPISISMGAFAINDYFDVAADRANGRTDRPIVNGSIGKKEALRISLACTAVGIASSLFINIYAFSIAAIFGILAFLYAYRLKGMLILGNAYIALSMVIPFIYGSYVAASGVNANIILISFVIFLSGFAREIHGMIRDYAGDVKERHVKNLVYHIGTARSAYLAAILYVEAIAISLFMFILKLPFQYNLAYLAPIMVVDAMLFYVAIGYMRVKNTRSFFKLSRNLSLGAMALALVIYLIVPLLYIPI
jgi:4-hydroxybenzoate polyprenyltransferase